MVKCHKASINCKCHPSFHFFIKKKNNSKTKQKSNVWNSQPNAKADLNLIIFSIAMTSQCNGAMAVIAAESAVKYTFALKRHANEAKGSIQCKVDPFASFVCRAADNCDSSY